MKRRLTFLLLFIFAVSSLVTAAPKKKKKGPCASSLAKCPVTGCGGDIDKNLNRRKNIRTAPAGEPEDMTIADMKALPDPVDGFGKGDTRGKLAALGEGKKIRVVALALVVRAGSQESCNCGLTGAANTDNHIVLIDPDDTTPSLEADEDESVTAEFTPRVRLKNPNLARAKLKPLIDSAPNSALKVRMTGVLMFDSEHSLGRHLKRHNNWEIHPLFRLEYCPNGQACSADSDANWRNLNIQTPSETSPAESDVSITSTFPESDSQEEQQSETTLAKLRTFQQDKVFQSLQSRMNDVANQIMSQSPELSLDFKRAQDDVQRLQAIKGETLPKLILWSLDNDSRMIRHYQTSGDTKYAAAAFQNISSLTSSATSADNATVTVVTVDGEGHRKNGYEICYTATEWADLPNPPFLTFANPSKSSEDLPKNTNWAFWSRSFEDHTKVGEKTPKKVDGDKTFSIGIPH